MSHYDTCTECLKINIKNENHQEQGVVAEDEEVEEEI